jgi:hypothetical protein
VSEKHYQSFARCSNLIERGLQEAEREAEEQPVRTARPELELPLAATTEKPVWSKLDGVNELKFGGKVCLTITRSDATNQIKILDAFQGVNWENPLVDPIGDHDKFSQTLRDLNKQLKCKPIKFIRSHSRVSWSRTTD